MEPCSKEATRRRVIKELEGTVLKIRCQAFVFQNIAKSDNNDELHKAFYEKTVSDMLAEIKSLEKCIDEIGRL